MTYEEVKISIGNGYAKRESWKHEYVIKSFNGTLYRYNPSQGIHPFYVPEEEDITATDWMIGE